MKRVPEEIFKKHLQDDFRNISDRCTGKELKAIFLSIIKAMNEFKYGERVNHWTYRIITRLLMFIPWLLTQLIGLMILLSKQIINYIRFGGESITYTIESRQRLINDVFIKVNELVNDKNK